MQRTRIQRPSYPQSYVRAADAWRCAASLAEAYRIWKRPMNLDYTVMAAISYNLEDAQEELAQISKMFRPDIEVDEAEFKVRMAHLYSHLNIAWNMRNVSEADLESADSERMNAWGRFPTDLEPFP